MKQSFMILSLVMTVVSVSGGGAQASSSCGGFFANKNNKDYENVIFGRFMSRLELESSIPTEALAKSVDALWKYDWQKRPSKIKILSTINSALSDKNLMINKVDEFGRNVLMKFLSHYEKANSGFLLSEIEAYEVFKKILNHPDLKLDQVDIDGRDLAFYAAGNPAVPAVMLREILLKTGLEDRTDNAGLNLLMRVMRPYSDQYNYSRLSEKNDVWQSATVSSHIVARLEKIDVLLEFNPNIVLMTDKHGNNGFSYAIASQRKEFFDLLNKEILVKDYNYRNKAGDTYYMHAISRRSVYAIEQLNLRRDIDFNAINEKDNNRTALMMVYTRASNLDGKGLIEHVLKNDHLDLSVVDADGRTVISYAKSVHKSRVEDYQKKAAFDEVGLGKTPRDQTEYDKGYSLPLLLNYAKEHNQSGVASQVKTGLIQVKAKTKKLLKNFFDKK